jgi:hypothetical protein
VAIHQPLEKRSRHFTRRFPNGSQTDNKGVLERLHVPQSPRRTIAALLLGVANGMHASSCYDTSLEINCGQCQPWPTSTRSLLTMPGLAVSRCSCWPR